MLRKELRPKLIDSGYGTLKKICPICNKKFMSDQEELMEKEKKPEPKKEINIDLYSEENTDYW